MSKLREELYQALADEWSTIHENKDETVRMTRIVNVVVRKLALLAGIEKVAYWPDAESHVLGLLEGGSVREPVAEPPKASTEQIGGSHYKSFAIQPAEFITRNNLSFLAGCVIKRMCRHHLKNGREDLLKAKHEIDLMLELEYGGRQNPPDGQQSLQDALRSVLGRVR